MAASGQVDPGRLGEADEIHAAMLEKAPVFDGKYGVNKDFGYLIVLDQLAAGTLFGVKQRRDHLRFEFVGSQVARLTRNAFYLPAS